MGVEGTRESVGSKWKGLGGHPDIYRSTCRLCHEATGLHDYLRSGQPMHCGLVAAVTSDAALRAAHNWPPQLSLENVRYLSGDASHALVRVVHCGLNSFDDAVAGYESPSPSGDSPKRINRR